MSDDTKNVNQNTPSVVQTDQSQTQPIDPVGSVSKETGPIVSAPPVSEFVKPSETEPEISQELKEIGVKKEKDEPDLTFEHKKMGVDHAKQFSPIPTSTGKVSLPMSEEEMLKAEKGQDDDSGKWFAGLIKKIIKAMGI